MTPAYLLCIFLGTLGLHRFYMRRKGSGLAMLLITVLSLGFLGLFICLPWAIVDLFLIPGIIRPGGHQGPRRGIPEVRPGPHPGRAVSRLTHSR